MYFATTVILLPKESLEAFHGTISSGRSEINKDSFYVSGYPVGCS